MFKEARIKLTAWYLVIIMTISLFFSFVIYVGVNRELTRIESTQSIRIQRSQTFLPPEPIFEPETAQDFVTEARARILLTLGFVNLTILVLSGMGGYFLAGRTLDPISRMVDEQKAFVSDASHELRTPLTSLKAEMEVALMNKKLSSKEAKKVLASNLEDVNNMQSLTNYLLKLSSYGENDQISMARVDLKGIVLHAIGKRKVKTDLSKTYILGNKAALTELVSILLDNAFKYSTKRAVEVKVHNGTLEVKDHGPGIAKVDLPHIFDRFYRSDKSRGTEGYGLGLSIAKSIVDVHKAKIDVQTKLGKGTVFKITF